MKDFKQWDGFAGRLWKEGVDVRDFIQNNYTPYDGDDSFLEGPTEATDRLWGKVSELQKEERAKGGVLDMETDVVTGITAYGAAYIDDSMKDMEQVVGLQTDKPLKRAFTDLTDQTTNSETAALLMPAAIYPYLYPMEPADDRLQISFPDIF